jgi:hypothetical protein
MAYICNYITEETEASLCPKEQAAFVKEKRTGNIKQDYESRYQKAI